MKFKIGDKVYDKRREITGKVVHIRSSRVGPYEVELQDGTLVYKSGRDMEMYENKEEEQMDNYNEDDAKHYFDGRLIEDISSKDDELRDKVSHIMGACFGSHDDCWYVDNISDEGLDDNEADQKILNGVVAFIKQYGIQERIDDFKRMRNYYGRGNIKLWDEPDNNHNSVYLDDHIAELNALKDKEQS